MAFLGSDPDPVFLEVRIRTGFSLSLIRILPNLDAQDPGSDLIVDKGPNIFHIGIRIHKDRRCGSEPIMIRTRANDDLDRSNDDPDPGQRRSEPGQ